jgi:uncharacterized membrane protein YdjX (TVP38/TMEM64 family)/rhodanese-related sulfurtransferase
MTGRRYLARATLLLAVLAPALWAAFHRDQINLATLNAWVDWLGVWAPLGYVALFALATVAFAPGVIFGLAGGALFGPLWGTVWNLLGATLGATLSLLIARYIAGDWVERKAGGRLKRLIDGVEAEGWRFVAFVRLVPLFPFNLSNYVLGLTRIPLRHFVLTSLVCMASGTIAYTLLGHAGRGVLAGEASAIQYGLFGLGLFAAIALLPRMFRRMRNPSSWIEAGELKRRLYVGEAVTIIDVRQPDEFTGPLGHIPGARNLPLADLGNRLVELGERQQVPIILVCRTDKRSATAAQLLKAAGFSQVTVLRNGIEQWNS